MQITRNGIETRPGPGEWFTGTVYVDAVAAPPGDRVFFEPGEEHWHGAAPDRFMTHLPLLEVDDDGTSATWGEHVTDEEYGAPTP